MELDIEALDIEAMDIEAMIAEAVIAAELQTGVHARNVAVAHGDYAGKVQALVPMLARNKRPPRWSAAEEAQLASELGQYSLEEIAKKHGRTPAAIKVRFTRKGMTAPSRHPDEFTCQKLAEMLGKDPKGMANIIDKGILPGRELPMNAKIRVVKRLTFYRWVIRPESWLYFKVEQIVDPKLRRLVQLAQARWDDEWLSMGEAARLIGHKETHLLNKWINNGRVPYPGAVQWGNWWVKRSAMLDTSWRNAPNNGELSMIGWSRSDDAFIVLARAIGFSWTEINTLRKRSNTEFRFRQLVGKGAVVGLTADYHLPVEMKDNGVAWVDWRIYRHRFPRVLEAVRRFKAGEKLDKRSVSYLRGICWSWARWFTEDAQLIKALSIGGTMTSVCLRKYYGRMLAMGIDPFAIREDE